MKCLRISVLAILAFCFVLSGCEKKVELTEADMVALERYKKRAETGDGRGKAALHIAAQEGEVKVAAYLLQAEKADINVGDYEGITPLGYAIHENNTQMIQFLIDKGADVNARKKKDGSSLLHLAVAWNKVDGVRLLLENGADPNIENNRGETPLFDVWVSDNPEIIDLLIEHKADPNHLDHDGDSALHSALIISCPHNTVKKLVEAGADVNALGPDNRTPLSFAVCEEDAEVIRNAGGQ